MLGESVLVRDLLLLAVRVLLMMWVSDLLVLAILMRDVLVALWVRGMLHLVVYVRVILGVLAWMIDVLLSAILDFHEAV